MSSREEIKQAIAALELQRNLLGNATVDAAIYSLRKELDNQFDNPERKWVTIMFADISGFTALSEKKDPEEVRGFMNNCFNYLVPVVKKYKGHVDKFIGDEIMALFGAPFANEKHAELACRCGLEMMEALQAFNREFDLSLGLHIGMNTGLVVAGGVGSTEQQQYSVMGDAVNLGARLKDKSTNGQIFCGPDLYQQTHRLFNFTPLEPLPLKGKAEPVQVYALTGEKSLDSFQDSRYFDQSPIVGRDSELAKLHAAIDRLEKGEGSVISVIGEAGIGKSRLIRECRNMHGIQVKWWEGRSQSHLETVSYIPIRDILLNITETNNRNVGRLSGNNLKDCLSDLPGDNNDSIYPFLATLMGLSLTESELLAMRVLEPSGLKIKFQDAFQVFIGKLSALSPTVLVFEDVHWADDETLDMLKCLSKTAFNFPIVLILLFRPDREDECWALHENLTAQNAGYQTIELDSLTPGECSQLILHYFESSPFMNDIAALVFERTEGNPFYTEEVLRSIYDRFGRDEDISTVRQYLQDVIPNSLQGIVAARIDQLNQEVKTVLQVASIMGRLIDMAILENILTEKTDPSILLQYLQILVHRDMLRPHNSEIASGYIFKHSIIQEVAYNSMLMTKRRELHEQCARSLIKIYGKAQAFVSAGHFEQADALSDSLEQYLLSADDAASSFAHYNEATARCKAADVYAKILLDQKLVNFSGPIYELSEKAGDVCLKTLDLTEAKRQFLRAVEQVTDGDSITKSRLMRKIGLCYEIKTLESQEEIDQWQQLAEKTLLQVAEKTDGWWNEWIEIQLDKCWKLYWRGDGSGLSNLIDKIRHEIEEHGSPAQQGRFMQSNIMHDFLKYRFRLPTDTVELSEKLYKSVSSIPDNPMLLTAKSMLGFTYLWADRLDDCIREMEASLPYALQAGDMVIATRIMVYQVVAWRRKKNMEKVESLTRECINSGKFLHQTEFYTGYFCGNEIWLCWKRRNFDPIEGLYKKVKSVIQTDTSGPFNFIHAYPMAAWCAETSQTERAISFLKEMMNPKQRRFEPELESKIEALISSLPIKEEKIKSELKIIIKMGEQYGYL